jgi:hypothetical protein
MPANPAHLRKSSEVRAIARASRYHAVVLRRHDAEMVVTPERLLAALPDACEDAGVTAALVIAWIVEAAWPTTTSPIAYIAPASYVTEETVTVFRVIGAARVDEHHLGGHRVAVWQTFDGVPDAALPVMLRHELEHAARWECSGTAFFDADQELRALVRGNHDGYAALPTEREANAASSRYATRVLNAGDIRELRARPDFADLTAEVLAPADVVEETLATLLEHDGWKPEWPEADREDYVRRCRKLVGEWEAHPATLDTERHEPLILSVAPCDR